MSILSSLLIRAYDRIILERPRLILLCLLAIIVFLGYKAKDFKLDASARTLILETDQDLRYSQLIESRYGGHDYLLMAYTPEGDLFSDRTLNELIHLRAELRQLPSVSAIVSILDVPLLQSPPVPVRELATRIQTLESPAVDRKLAEIEFGNSPLYRDLLVSKDLKTTALQIKFHTDKIYQDLLNRRGQFLDKQMSGPLSANEVAQFKRINDKIQKYRDERRKTRHQDIATIRAVMDNYRGDAELFLGGISMITDDLISFIKKDLKIFGLGVLFFLILTLGIIFRNKRWIILPILCCASSAVAMMGLLGMFGWRVTVISSNFISLQLIVTMAITIHLIVRYRFLLINHPATEQRQLILDTVRQMMTPCLFAALTTIAGFGSLLFCDILPVKTFGWMMIAGISVSLLLTFLIFPAGLMLLEKKAIPAKKKSRYSLTSFLAGFTEALGLGKIDLGGMSLGGRNAIGFAGLYPERVKHLILLDIGPEMPKRGSKDLNKRVLSPPLGFRSEEDAMEFYRQRMPRASDEILRQRVRYGLRLNWADKLVFKQDPDLVWSTGSAGKKEIPMVWELLAKITCPVLILRGAESDLLSPEIAERMLQVLPYGKYVEIQDAGHFIPEENPVAFEAEVRRFLET